MARKRHPKDIEACELPTSLSYLWVHFWDISAGRPVWQGGFRPIPAVEFLAWQQLHDIQLERWELETLRKLDALFLKIIAEESPDD